MKKMLKYHSMICPLCKNKEGINALESWLMEDINYSIYQCPRCLLQFAFPMKQMSASGYESVEWYGVRWEFKETLNFLKNKKGTLLEIGCGKGFFLKKAMENGFIVTGIDINSSAIKEAKELGFDRVYPYTLEDFILTNPQKKFDIVCFYHVLEHVENPIDFILKTKKFLKKDGYIVFSVPNPDRLAPSLLKRELWDYPPHHLTRWNETSIDFLLTKAGLEKVGYFKEPLSFVKSIEDVGSSLEAFLFSLIKKRDEENKKHLHKRYQWIKKIVKPILKLLLTPIGCFFYLLSKIKGLTGQAVLVIAKPSNQ